MVRLDNSRSGGTFTLTTVGTSGAATYVGGVLNIPVYSGATNFVQVDTGTNQSVYSGFISAQNLPYGVTLGYLAGDAIDASTNFVVAIGEEAARNAASATNLLAIGQKSGFGATFAQDSIMMGRGAGFNSQNAANVIYMGQDSGSGDTLDTTVTGWGIAIGYKSKLNSYQNSIAFGGAAAATKINQFALADTITNVRWRGVEYNLPSAQASVSSVLTNDGSGNLSWQADTGYLMYFGDGSDGDVTITGTVSLARNMYYRNLTISGAGTLSLNGFNIFIQQRFDISNAGANAVQRNGSNGNSAAANSATGGTAPTATGGAIYMGIGGNGGVGASSTTTNGNNGGIPAAPTNPGGGQGGYSGKGGNSGANTGGTALGPVTATITPFRNLSTTILRGTQVIGGGLGGPGGGSGAGDGTNSGGGAGSGATGAGAMAIFAYELYIGSSTNATAISLRGGNGGNGSTRTTGNVGGGGGGAPGAGGFLYLVTYKVTYASGTPGTITFVNADSGTGGNGGNGIGTGIGGTAGGTSDGGVITYFILSTGVANTIVGSSGTAATPVTSGITGGTGLAPSVANGGQCRLTL